jgi:hypothetical protein
MTQISKILKSLKSGKPLTVAQARTRYGVTNLRARVCELRGEGVSVQTITTKGGLTAYTM